MTKKLEELLDLPEVKETMEQVEEPKTVVEVKKETDNLERSIAEFDKISAALPMVKGLGELADKELDDLAEKAKQSYEDLMDLGMNVESRYAGRVFETASNMLKNAIDAKSQKLDKKLKMVELQLKKQNIDQKQGENADTVDAEGYVVMDRNAILDKILNKDQDK
jgi:hypothetical protein|tara:strand:- start:656 stop:1150 length:495 start_codon:yes stop_codon:yes gene_type:complete